MHIGYADQGSAYAVISAQEPWPEASAAAILIRPRDVNFPE